LFRKPVQSPVIILGMHRSGTSLVTRLAEALGLFVGWRKDEYHEAPFFQRINQWLLTQSGGSWDNPAPFRYLLENTTVRARATHYIACSLLESPHLIEFLGLAKYLRYRSAYALDIRWGWKDPRNTFTLPIWLDLFPGAKVIYIQRQSEEVAASLQRRGRMDCQSHRLYERLGILHWIVKRAAFVRSPRCDWMQGGHSLWQEYVSQAATNLSSLRNRVLELEYEDILCQPYQSVGTLARFCQLDVSAERLQTVAALVKRPPDSESCSLTVTLPPAVISPQSSARSDD